MTVFDRSIEHRGILEAQLHQVEFDRGADDFFGGERQLVGHRDDDLGDAALAHQAGHLTHALVGRGEDQVGRVRALDVEDVAGRRDRSPSSRSRSRASSRR